MSPLRNDTTLRDSLALPQKMRGFYDDLESRELRDVFQAAVGLDVDAAAQCTADVLMSAGVLDMGADWTLPS